VLSITSKDDISTRYVTSPPDLADPEVGGWTGATVGAIDIVGEKDIDGVAVGTELGTVDG
jgi:hypothetical protein